MKPITLRTPDAGRKADILAYKTEFIGNGEISIDGSAGLQNAQDISEWLDKIQKCRTKETVPDGLVPSSTYLVCNEQGELIGMLDIRHFLNEHLFACGGHIGYSVRPTQRRQGYATGILAKALEICAAELDIKRFCSPAIRTMPAVST